MGTLNWLLLSVGVGFACAASPARATPQVFEFSGIIDYVEDGLGMDSSVVEGATFMGSYRFDPATVVDGAVDDSRVGSYYLGSSSRLIIEIGHYEFVTSDLGILVWNNVNGEDLYEVGTATPFFSAGHQWILMAMLLRDRTGSAFVTDALPTTPPNLEDFSFETSIRIVEDGHSPAISGTLSSLVPEPSSLVTLAIGITVCAGRGLRRQSWPACKDE